MGEAELDTGKRIIFIHSHLITYGDAADETIAAQMRDEIETMWNEPAANLLAHRGFTHSVVFGILAAQVMAFLAVLHHRDHNIWTGLMSQPEK